MGLQLENLRTDVGVQASHLRPAALLEVQQHRFQLIGVETEFAVEVPGADVLVRMALNAIDGMLAREYEKTTKFGCILNELGDVLSDVLLYLPFALLEGIFAPLIVGIVILAIVSEMVGVLGYVIDYQRHYEGPMGKSDRALVFGVIGLILGWGIEPTQWLTILLSAVIFLQLWTIGNRIQGMLQEVESWK